MRSTSVRTLLIPRNADEYDELCEDLELFNPAFTHPPQALALDIQQSLWERRLVRAAGNCDIMIAANAIANNPILINCDRDFGDFRQEIRRRIARDTVPAAAGVLGLTSKRDAARRSVQFNPWVREKVRHRAAVDAYRSRRRW